MSTIQAPADGSLVAAGPFRRLWKYVEAFWIRDRKGRWLKYIGPKQGPLWDVDPASGREAPNFPIVDVFDSRVARTPRYKGRLASPRLDDGSVIMEVGRRGDALGRGADPVEADYDGVSRELPENLAPGETAFVRVDPDTIETAEKAARKGGRARISEPARPGRASLPGVEDVLEPPDGQEPRDDAWQRDADLDGVRTALLETKEAAEEHDAPRRSIDLLDDALDLVDQTAQDDDDSSLERLRDGLEYIRATNGEDGNGEDGNGPDAGVDAALEDALLELDALRAADAEQDRAALPEPEVLPEAPRARGGSLEDDADYIDGAIRDAAAEAGAAGEPEENVAYGEDLQSMLELVRRGGFDPDDLIGLEELAGEAADAMPDSEGFRAIADDLVPALADRALERDRGARADLEPEGPDAWGPAAGRIMDMFGEGAGGPAEVEPALSSLPEDAWDTPTGLPAGDWRVIAPRAWAREYTGGDRVLRGDDVVDISVGPDGEIESVGSADLPAGVEVSRDEALALAEAVGLRREPAAFEPDGAEFTEVPASELPVWGEIFSPEDLDGWVGSPDDPSMLFSEDNRWVLDADPESMGEEGVIGLFDTQSSTMRRFALDDPALEQALAVARGGEAPVLADQGVDAWRVPSGERQSFTVPSDWSRSFPGTQLSPGDIVEAEYDDGGNLVDLSLPDDVDGIREEELAALEDEAGISRPADPTSDYLDDLEAAIQEAGAGVPPEVAEALEAVDAVVEEDGSVALDASSDAIGDAVRALDDADVAIGPETTPEAENLSGAVQDAADALDAAIDPRAAAEDADGTRPPRVPLDIEPPDLGEVLAQEELARYGGEASRDGAGRYEDARQGYTEAMAAGDEEAAAGHLRGMQQALSDLAAEMAASDDPEVAYEARKLQAANRRLGTALRKGHFDRTKIDRRQQPKARARREQRAANRAEKQRNAAITRKARALQRLRREDFDALDEQTRADWEALDPQRKLDVLTSALGEDQVPLADRIRAAVAPQEEGGAEEAVAPVDPGAYFDGIAAEGGPLAQISPEGRARVDEALRHMLGPDGAGLREQFESLSPAAQRAVLRGVAVGTSRPPAQTLETWTGRAARQAEQDRARVHMPTILDAYEGQVDQIFADDPDQAYDINEAIGRVRAALDSGDDRAALEESRSLLLASEALRNRDGILYNRLTDSVRALRERIESVNSQGSPTSSTDSPNRSTVEGAIGGSDLSDNTRARARTAVSTADIADSVDADPAANRNEGQQRDGDPVNPGTSDAIAQSGSVTEIGTGGEPPSLTAGEAAASVAQAAYAEDLVRLPMGQQAAAIFDLIESDPALRSRLDNYIFQPRGPIGRSGRPRRPQPSRRAKIAAIDEAGELSADQQQSLGSTLFQLRKYFNELSDQAPTDRMRAQSAHLRDRTTVLLDRYLAEHGISISQYTSGQDTWDERAARMRRVMEDHGALFGPQTEEQGPPQPREYAAGDWWYMQDYDDDADYSNEAVNLAAVLDELGGNDTSPINRLAVDPSNEAARLKAQRDLSRFMALVARNRPEDRWYREEVLERVINHLNRVGGEDYDPDAAALRDELVSIRDRAHNHGGSTVWDETDDTLNGVRDWLIQHQGGNRGRIVTNAKKAIDDALREDPGTERRWSALARARNELDVLHARELIPAMNALRIKTEPHRLRDLGSITRTVAIDNIAPRRPQPRGTAWDDADLQQLSDMAAQLGQEAGQLQDEIPQLQRKTANRLNRAVAEYRRGRYGEFEQLLARSMSSLMQVDDVARFEALGALRDQHWAPDDWEARVRALRAGIIQRLGRLPRSRQIVPQNGDLLDPQRNRQDGRALVAEALSRTNGSLEQRTQLTAALWYLNQADDPRDVQLRDLLRDYDPNGDLLGLAAQRPTIPSGSPGDARIARAIQIGEVFRTDGMVMRGALADQFGQQAGDIDNLVQPLLDAGVFVSLDEIAGAPFPDGDQMYFPGPVLQQQVNGLPMSQQAWNDIIGRTMAGENISTSVQRQDPKAHAFGDPRITVDEDGTVRLGPGITASWDEDGEAWAWQAYGADGEFADAGVANTLEDLGPALARAADAHGVQGADETGDGEDGDGEGAVPRYAAEADAVAGLADRATSEIGSTDVAGILDGAAEALRAGRAQEARSELERAAARLLDDSGVLSSSSTERSENYDPDRNLAVGTLYADIRQATGALPEAVDLSETIDTLTRLTDPNSSSYTTDDEVRQVYSTAMERVRRIDSAAEAEALRQELTAEAERTRSNYPVSSAYGAVAYRISNGLRRMRTDDSYYANRPVRNMARAAGVATPEQQALINRAQDLAPTDPVGSWFTLRQASLDMLEQRRSEGGSGLPEEMVTALSSTQGMVSSRGVRRIPEGVEDSALAQALQDVTEAQRVGADYGEIYRAARRVSDLATAGAINPSYTPEQRRALSRFTATAAAAMDEAGNRLAQVNALRQEGGDIVRRPTPGTPGVPVVDGVSLIPGDVVNINGRPHIYQSGTPVDTSPGRTTAMFVDLDTGADKSETTYADGTMWGSLVSASPQAASPVRHWGRVGQDVSPEDRQRIMDQHGLMAADAVVRLAQTAPTVEQIFDAGAPLAVREQAAYDLITGIRRINADRTSIGVDLSTPDRAVITGSLPGERGDPETFRWEISRNGDLPVVHRVSFSGQPLSASRAARQQDLLREVERYGISHGALSVQIADPNNGGLVSAANAGYDFDDIAMGGFEPTRAVVRRMLARAAREANGLTAVEAAVEQMLRDTDAAVDVDGLPTPFEIANIHPGDPKIGRRAISAAQWMPVRHLTGPSRHVARAAAIEQRQRQIASEQRRAGFSNWGDDRVPALVKSLADQPNMQEMGRNGFPGLSAVMNAVNDATLSPGQPGLALRVSGGSMSESGHGNVSFNVMEFLDPAQAAEQRRIGETELSLDHDAAINFLGRINEYQKLHKQALPTFDQLFSSHSNEYYGTFGPGIIKVSDGQGGTRPATQDDIERVFNGDMKAFRGAVGRTRQTWNLDAMRKVHQIGPNRDIPMTMPQILKARDALWRGRDSTAEHVSTALLDAGVDAETAQALMANGPATAVDALTTARDTLTGTYLQSGGGGSFSFNGNTVYTGSMFLKNHTQGGGVATLLQKRLMDWTVAHETPFKYADVSANGDVGSLAWALAGFGFNGGPESRRSSAEEMLRWLYGASPSPEEKVLLDAMASRIRTERPSDPNFPAPIDIASIGLAEAYSGGDKNWIGKRGIVGGGKNWSGRMVLAPDRIYNQARGLRLISEALSAQARANQASAPPFRERTGPGSLSEVDAAALLDPFADRGYDATRMVPALRRAASIDDGFAEGFRGLSDEQQRVVLDTGTVQDARAMTDAASILAGTGRPALTAVAGEQDWSGGSSQLGRLLEMKRGLDADPERAGRFDRLAQPEQEDLIRRSADWSALSDDLTWVAPEPVDDPERIEAARQEIERVLGADFDGGAGEAGVATLLSDPLLSRNYGQMSLDRMDSVLRAVAGGEEPTTALRPVWEADRSEVQPLVDSLASDVTRRTYGSYADTARRLSSLVYDDGRYRRLTEAPADRARVVQAITNSLYNVQGQENQDAVLRGALDDLLSRWTPPEPGSIPTAPAAPAGGSSAAAGQARTFISSLAGSDWADALGDNADRLVGIVQDVIGDPVLSSRFDNLGAGREGFYRDVQDLLRDRPDLTPAQLSETVADRLRRGGDFFTPPAVGTPAAPAATPDEQEYAAANMPSGWGRLLDDTQTGQVLAALQRALRDDALRARLDEMPADARTDVLQRLRDAAGMGASQTDLEQRFIDDIDNAWLGMPIDFPTMPPDEIDIGDQGTTIPEPLNRTMVDRGLIAGEADLARAAIAALPADLRGRLYAMLDEDAADLVARAVRSGSDPAEFLAALLRGMG